jgi:hypothetical protein
MSVHIEAGDPDDFELFRLDGNSLVIKSGSKSFGDTVILYADVPLDQYDYYDGSTIEIIDNEYFGFIGKTLVAFSKLEHLIDQCIVKMTSDRADVDGMRLSSMFTFIQKVNYFVDATKIYLENDDLNKIKKLYKRIVTAVEVRNLVAHAKWDTLTADGYVRCGTRSDKDGWIYFRYYEFTSENLVGIEEDVDKLSNGILKFIHDSERLSEMLYDIADSYEEEDD